MSKICPVCKQNTLVFREFLTGNPLFIKHSKAQGVECEMSLRDSRVSRVSVKPPAQAREQEA